jgi:predicted DNA-binding transcriptional regulator AlpA
MSSTTYDFFGIYLIKFPVYNIKVAKPIKKGEKSMSNEYYSLEDLIKLLNKSRSTIIRDTNAGKIPSEGKKGSRRYPKEAIDAMIEIKEQKRNKNKEPDVIFSPSTPNDTWQEVKIGKELYGEDDIVPYKTLLKWNEVNNEMYMSLKYKKEVVGYSSLMPLEEGIIIKLIRDEIRERDIPTDAIKQWTDQNISVYVCSVTVKPSGDKGRDAERAGIIIKNTMKWALRLDRQTRIKNWYSIGATKEGQKLLETLGFEEIASLYNGERKGYYLEDIRKPVGMASRLLDQLNQEPSAAL